MEGSYEKIIIAYVLLSLVLLIGCNKHEPYRLSQGDKALLCDGDIIMRRGHGMLSDLIVTTMHDSLNVSHCGIITRHNREINVIHCIAPDISPVDGIQTCSIDEFTNDCIPGTLVVVRCQRDSLHCLSKGAMHYLSMHKTFDHSFNLADTTQFFCSELPLRILKDSLDIDLISNTSFPRFSLFLDKRYFKLVFTDEKNNRDIQ